VDPDPTKRATDDTAVPPTPAAGSGQTISAQQAEALAKDDLASFLKVAADQIQIVATASRTWPDKGLGCARKGFYEPQPVPGYEITLAHGGATYSYRADQQGKLVRCVEAGKPIAAK
jgi:hypothetical protein